MNSVRQAVGGKLIAGSLLGMFLVSPLQVGAALTPQQQADLQARIAAYYQSKGQTTQSSTVPSATCGMIYTWSRDLAQGMTGADVMKLQQLLNKDAATQVASVGVGSRGQETQYSGPATAAAVKKFQVKYSLAQTSRFDSATRTKANELCKAVTTTPTTPAPQTPTTQTPTPTTPTQVDTPVVVKNQKEATIRNFKAMSAPDSDELEEGDAATEVFGFEFEVKDADITVQRVDVALAATGEVKVKEPWRQMKAITLFVDGKEVATKSVNSKGAWSSLGNNQYQVRLSGLSVGIEKNDTAEMYVAVTPLNSIDSGKLPQQWQIWVPDNGVRAIDGVTSSSMTGKTSAKKTFTIKNAGDDEELRVSVSPDNPKATTLRVKRNDVTKNVNVLTFELKAEGGDLDLESLPLTITTDASSTYAALVARPLLKIGNTTYAKSTVVGEGTSEATVTFNFDKKIRLQENKKVTVEVLLDLKKLTGNYAEGTTIEASVTGGNTDAIEVEGDEEVPSERLSGSAFGRTHTVRSEGVSAAVGTGAASVTAERDKDSTKGTYSITFSVTAFGGDFYIPMDTARLGSDQSTVIAGETDAGVFFTVLSQNGVTISGTTSSILSSNAKESGDAYVVYEGQTKNFTLSVAYRPEAEGFYRVAAHQVAFRKVGEANADAIKHTLTPAQEFDTEVVFLKGQ